MSRKSSSPWGGSATESQTAFDPVVHLQQSDVPELISDFPFIHHSDSIILVVKLTISCDSDNIAAEAEREFHPLQTF